MDLFYLFTSRTAIIAPSCKILATHNAYINYALAHACPSSTSHGRFAIMFSWSASSHEGRFAMHFHSDFSNMKAYSYIVTVLMQAYSYIVTVLII